MSQFDIYENRAHPGYLLDCQSDLLSHLNTRLVAPLLPKDYAPLPTRRLNPSFEFRDEELVLMTHFASAVPARSLGKVVGSLAEDYVTVMAAIDMLITGY